MEREPVRVAGWTAIVVGSVLALAVLWSSGAPWPTIVGAVGAMLLAEVGGVEWARKHVTPVAWPSLPADPDGEDS